MGKIKLGRFEVCVRIKGLSSCACIDSAVLLDRSPTELCPGKEMRCRKNQKAHLVNRAFGMGWEGSVCECGICCEQASNSM